MSKLASSYFKVAQAASPVAEMLERVQNMDDEQLNALIQSFAPRLASQLGQFATAIDAGMVDTESIDQFFSRLSDDTVGVLASSIDPNDFASLARHLSDQVINRFEAAGLRAGDPTPAGDGQTPGVATEDITSEVASDPKEQQVAANEAVPGSQEGSRPWQGVRSILEPERQALDRFYDQIRQTEEVEAPDEISGFDAAPNQWVNARDTHGNWYRIDDAGRTYRFDQTGTTPEEQWTRMPELDTIGRGGKWGQAFEQDVQGRVDQLVNEHMTHGHRPGHMSEADWMDSLRQQLRPRAERAARNELKSEGARRIGLGYIGDLQDTFGRVHFRRSDGRPFIQTMEGMQPVDSRELWRAQNPQAAHNHDRWLREREQQLYDPRWIAGQMRAYQAAGEQMPDHLQQHIRELTQAHPQFASQVQAHQMAMSQMGTQQGVNYTELYNQALSDVQPQPESPPPRTPAPTPDTAAQQRPAPTPELPDPKRKLPQPPEQKLAARAPKFPENRNTALPVGVQRNTGLASRRTIVPGQQQLARDRRINQALSRPEPSSQADIQRLQRHLRARGGGPLATAARHNTAAIAQPTDFGQLRDRGGLLGQRGVASPMRARSDHMGSWGRPVFNSRFRLRGM